MIIGITGMLLDREGGPLVAEGAGKTTVADMLVRHGFVVMGIFDVGKRFAGELFGFSREQLFGSSSSRNAPDLRYPVPYGHLTPRHALQQLGTEVARSIYQDVWINYALKTAQELLRHNGHKCYTPEEGLRSRWSVDDAGWQDRPWPPAGVVLHNVRYKNEFDAIRSVGQLIRIRRPSDKPPLDIGEHNHPSSTALLGLPDGEFDLVIENDGDLAVLQSRVTAGLMALREKRAVG